jgi:phosphoserine phosphatase RsbU/P
MNEKAKSNDPGAGAGTAAAPKRSVPRAFVEQGQAFSLLYETSRELTSILDRDELLTRIADRVRKIVNYHLFGVMLWNERAGQLQGVFAKHYEESIPSRFDVSLMQGITGHAAANRRSVRVDDVRLDPRYLEFPHSENVRSELVIPLLREDRLVGVLDLESTNVAAFTAENERMLEILGSYIAIALENSRLYEESREKEHRLQRDLDMARVIQRQLLPQGAKKVRGIDLASAYAPARQLAGDFYDFFSYGSSRMALALGDVSGKGTAAALYGSLAIGILREYTQDHRCWPEEMLAVLNGRLNAANMMPSYLALLYAVYDADLRQLILANAGLPRPILVRGADVSELKIEGTPLGMFAEVNYSSLTLALQPEDIVVIASDGILESMNAEDEQFGLDRLFDTLRNLKANSRCDEISAAIIRATDEFSGCPEEAHDDRTLIVLRVCGKKTPRQA